MLTLTTYSEAGGVGKTTLTANLAVAMARADRDVLVIDLDPQEGSLSHLLGVDDDRGRDDADSLVRHMIERPRGDFDDLMKHSEGVDVVPAHNLLEQLSKHLHRRAEEAADFGENYNVNKQLLRVLRDADVPSRYDALLIDPPATADEKLYNAIHATRNLVVPFEPSGKGKKSVEGLRELVEGIETQLNIEVGVLAVVPMGFKDTRDQRRMIEEIEDSGFDVPVTIRERSSLFQGCWIEQCSAFEFVEEHRHRQRDYEHETLEKLERLADELLATQEVEA